MSICARCGATFSCAMVAGEEAAAAAPPAGLIANVDDTDNLTSASSSASPTAASRCWCTYLAAAVPLPSEPGGACWCPTCLQAHIVAAAGLRNDAK